MSEETKTETTEGNGDLAVVRRSFSYEELAEHWKFCGNIFQMVKERNKESTNPIERDATKFTGECIIAIMDDLQALMDG